MGRDVEPFHAAAPHRLCGLYRPLQTVQSVRNSDVKYRLIERIYQAYLSDDLDIGDPQIQTALAAELGLPDEPIRKAAIRRLA